MKKLRVIIFDKEPVSRRLLRSSLSYWGCEVVTVQNAADACTALQAGNVDVCILNWEISGLKCLEACQRIRQSELKTQPHIIVLLEKSSRENIRAAYLAGANDYLTKPFRVEEVRSRISAIASKAFQFDSAQSQLQGLDPLECYRRDLAYQAKAQSHL
ncbi:MAG TPA: response regulator [Candidatus Angelobacter sp.]|nr:response regulator [Candidatus Angelobacter sp.]